MLHHRSGSMSVGTAFVSLTLWFSGLFVNVLAMHTLSYNNKQHLKLLFCALFLPTFLLCFCDRIINCKICVSLETWWQHPDNISYLHELHINTVKYCDICMYNTYRHLHAQRHARTYPGIPFVLLHWKPSKISMACQNSTARVAYSPINSVLAESNKIILTVQHARELKH